MRLNHSKTNRFMAASVALVCCMSGNLACQTRKAADCDKPSEDDKRCRVARKHTGPAAAAAPDTPPAASATEATVPHLSLDTLSDTGRRLFFDVVDDQFDPCGKPRSFGETLRSETFQRECPMALELAHFVVARVEAGEERRAIVLALIDRLRRQHNRSTFRVDGRPRRGPADAKVTVVEFFDYECPYCKDVQAELAKIVGRFPEAALVAKQLPIEGHPGSRPAALAALAAHRQGRYWEMHAALFQRNDALNEAGIAVAAKEVGLDLDRFQADRASLAVETMLREDREDADRALIEGTPSFWVDGVEVLFEELEDTLREKRRASGTTGTGKQ